MKIIVCDVDNMECMIHRGENCPGLFNALQTYLEKTFDEHEIDVEVYHTVNGKVLTRQFSKNILLLLKNILSHLFIRLTISLLIPLSPNGRKIEISNTSSCIILLDFAENYHYIVQDEIQGYHWNKDQCTLHLVVIYHKDGGNKLQCLSICLLSDDLEHDTNFVYELLRLTCNYIKETMPQVRDTQVH